MRSKVAEEVRRDQMRDIEKMSVSERVSLAFALGERDLQFYMATHRVGRDAAIRAIRREHQRGRRYSRCMVEE